MGLSLNLKAFFWEVFFNFPVPNCRFLDAVVANYESVKKFEVYRLKLVTNPVRPQDYFIT
jgi:hypothetical protein